MEFHWLIFHLQLSFQYSADGRIAEETHGGACMDLIRTGTEGSLRRRSV